MDEVRTLLEQTAEPLTDSQFTDYPNYAYGYGLINAYDAVAEIMGRDSVTLKGTVLQDGSDEAAATAEFMNLDECYLGRDIKVNVNITDDVSVRDASLTYKIGDSAEKTVKMTLTSGEQNNGVYSYTIKGEELTKGKLTLTAKVKDYGNHETVITKETDIKPGMTVPWNQDFEDSKNGLPGFIIDGLWSLSTRKNDAEPPLLGENNTTYMGIDGGHAYFQRRTDSNLYLPPIDLSNVTAADNPSLNVDMYKGFTGITCAKIQVSQVGGGEDSWTDIYDASILRPDITERDWEHCTISLADYAGSAQPLQIRFYFFGHDADDDDGVGWYIDNLSVTTNEKVAPSKVQSLFATLGAKGLRLSFDANEETDVTSYEIERKTGEGEFEKIADIKQNLDAFQFINNGEEESRPLSHYHVNYTDNTVAAGSKYTYRVRACDFSGNYSEYSDELNVDMSAYSVKASYDFEENNGGFITGILDSQKTANDWEHGAVTIPENVADMTMLPRNAWNGMAKNGTKVWGTKLDAKPNVNQDSYLLMPSVTVGEDEYLYFDSYCAMNSASESVRFTVDIKESTSDIWQPLVTREGVMNDDQIFTWWQIGASLDDYAGKTVDIRFHSYIDYGWLDNYNLGWYIDNVIVAKEQVVFRNGDVSLTSVSESAATDYDKGMGLDKSFDGCNDQMGLCSNINLMANSTTDGSAGIPINAKVSVLESGRYTQASVIDGTYSIKQASSEGGSYTLRFDAYGYESETVTVKGTGEVSVPAVYMKKADKVSFTGNVKDEKGNNIDGAFVRIVEDDNISPLATDNEGAYTGKSYTGTYTLRAFKEGYAPCEKEITLVKGENTIEDIILSPLANTIEETTDYGYVMDTDSEGYYQTIQFTSGPHGAAVRFQSPHKGGILKSADLFFVKNQYYSGDHVLVGVLAYNDEGRLVELAPFKEYKVEKPNAWNRVDFSEYKIETDKPLYVAVNYDMHEFSDCMGLYYDTDATEKAVEKSFIYDGAFTETKTVSPTGAYAIKANWLYADGAELNPESNEGNGGGSNTDIPVIDDENAFVFDKETQTITKYQGSKTDIVIPAEIDGVAVKKIGDEAFNGSGKDADRKIVSVTIPEGVEEIGTDAFKINEIAKISLPSTLKKIGSGAFKFQYSKDMELTIPEGVEVIEEGAFQSTSSPMKVTMKGVKKIEKLAFDGNRDIEVYADNLTEIADEAFGIRDASDFPYAKVYTSLDTDLQSVNKQYLINPAKVVVNEINSRDSEDVFGKSTLYGENLTSLGRNNDVSKYYKMGDKVTIAPPDFRKNGNIYSSADAPVELTLQKDNVLTFRYDTLVPHLRLPVLDTDTEILGFSLPNATVKVTRGDDTFTATANGDGYFTVSVSGLNENDSLAFSVNEKSAGTQTVTAITDGQQYIADGTKLLRYVGEGGSLTLPASIGESGSLTEIAPFAFAKTNLTEVTIPDTVETIGIGAFMDSGLESFGWNLIDLSSAKLRSIDEYAFRGNNLTVVTIPELTHHIRKNAFENNKIENLTLGKYTAHLGDRAFKNNKIKSVTLADTAEELGVEVFMDNEITSLTVKERLPGYTDGLEEIPKNAFANNKMTGVTLPSTITYVDETAFANNTAEGTPFTVTSEAKEITPTAGYDVCRGQITYAYSDSKLSLLDGFKDIMDVSKFQGSDGSVMLKATKKSYDNMPAITIYTASYNNNTVSSIDKIDFDFASVIVPKQSGSYKIFIWTDNLEPVMEAVSESTTDTNKLFN